MDTRKLGLILLGISGFMIIIAFMISIIGVSDINEIDVEEGEALLNYPEGNWTFENNHYFNDFNEDGIYDQGESIWYISAPVEVGQLIYTYDETINTLFKFRL